MINYQRSTYIVDTWVHHWLAGRLEEDGISVLSMRGDGLERVHAMKYLMQRGYLQKLLLVHGKWMNLTAQFMFGLIEMVILQI